MLSFIMLGVVMLVAIMLGVVMLSVVMLVVIMLSVIILGVIMLSAVMLGVVTPIFIKAKNETFSFLVCSAPTYVKTPSSPATKKSGTNDIKLFTIVI